GQTDGVSGANSNPFLGPRTGRTQFQPAVAVDPATGTVVVTYYDARYDATNSRVSRTLNTSIDGGQTFAPGAFLNSPGTVANFASGNTEFGTAYDPITQQPVTLGPIPDNQ